MDEFTQDIINAILEIAKKDKIENVSLFDCFSICKKHFGDNIKNVTFSGEKKCKIDYPIMKLND